MLFFTRGQEAALRRARRDPAAWLDAATSDAAGAMKHAKDDAATVVKHARDDIATAVKHAADDPATVVKHAGDDISRAVSQLRANSSDLADELIPTGRDAIRKSVDSVVMLVPAQRRRRRRSRLVGMLAAFAVTGLVLVVVRQVLLMRQSGTSWSSLGRDWAPGGEGSRTDGGLTSLPGRSAASLASTSPLGAGQRPPAEVPPDVDAEPATFDRDADLRAAYEGMEPPEAMQPASGSSEVADGT